jgi:AcrR family transcriptional regulator
MTPKKTDILKAAIELFSKNGYKETSTKKISEVAGVSEGLLFRHYQNKEGILTAVLNFCKTEIETHLQPVFKYEHPKVLLKHLIAIPLHIPNPQKKLWNLLYQLRMQNHTHLQSIFDLIHPYLEKAFNFLHCEDAKVESDLVILFLDAAICKSCREENNQLYMVVDSLNHKFDI